MSDSDFESSCHEDFDDSGPPKRKLKPNVLHENVKVKVDGNIYPLNRFQLALKSNYFEKLFIVEKNKKVVEIRELNSETFSAIIDLMNGNDLKSVMNADNYLALLMGMDYLQMEIDLSTVEYYIIEEYWRREDVCPLDVKVIELYNFVTVNQNYRYLERKILKYMSAHLIEIIKYDEELILSLPFEQFFKIIRRKIVMWCEFFGEKTVQAKQTLSQICSNWIRHDVENRLKHFPEIVNAANYGFYASSFLIFNEKLEQFFDEIKKDPSQERIEKCFQVLLSYRGEINLDVGQFRLGEKSLRKNRIVNKIDESEKLSRFLETGYLSDITIKAGSKTYKLHRYILDTASSYFSGPIPTSGKTSKLVVDIDEKIFDLIVDFIYFDKIPEFDSNSKTQVMQILKAAAILKSKLLMEKCCIPWIEKFKETLNSEEISEILNSTVGNNWQSECWVKNVMECFIRSLKGKKISKDVFRIWQICDSAGLKDSSYDFRRRVMWEIEEMQYTNLIQAFDVICEENNTGKYSYLYIACLCKLILAPKFELSIESHFVSVSLEVFEDLLASEYFVISDPQQIVDICSKWIVHDVENRYRLIPRIVFAINRNNWMDFSDFESNIPADLSNCSQEVVNKELWKLLNSNCLLSRDLGSQKSVWDFRTRPMFILPKNVDKDTEVPSEVCIVDSELNEMGTLNFLRNHYDTPKWDRLRDPKLSATLIGDTLFVLCEIRLEFRVYAYNFSSKKVNVLSSAPRPMYYPMDTLLNCNNQLFWCFDNGRVMKYSVELNRWLQLYSESNKFNCGPYGSDENKLLRYHNNALQIFDFEQSSWTHLVDLPPSSRPPKDLINIHNGIVLVYTPIFFRTMLLFNSKTQSWREIPIPGERNGNLPDFSEVVDVKVVSYGEDLLYVHGKGIQQLSLTSYSYSSRGWRLKKAASSDSDLMGIVAIRSLFDTDR